MDIKILGSGCVNCKNLEKVTRAALDELEKDDLVKDTLGDHIFEHFLTAKREEWHDYIRHISPWEIEQSGRACSTPRR